MNPIDFDESNMTLTKPESMTDEECSSLKVWTDGEECVSCWRPSFLEKLSILFFGKVWLSVLSGNTQPPVVIWGTRKAFSKK